MNHNAQRIRTIPAWFDLQKYAKARTFGPIDWAKNIEIRNRLLSDRSRQQSPEKLKIYFDLICEHGAVPSNLLETNVDKNIAYSQENKTDLVYDLPLKKAYEISEYFPPDGKVCRNLSVVESRKILERRKNLPLCDGTKPTISPAQAGISKLLMDITPNQVEVPLWDLPLSQSELALATWYEEDFMQATFDGLKDLSKTICIELTAPDEMIIQAFVGWLNQERKSRKGSVGIESRKKMLNENDFHHWMNYGVLPFLDLKIYMKETSTRISWNDIGNAIYPDQIGIVPSEKTRKTTVRHAGQAQKALLQLTSQIVAERKLKKLEK